MRVVKVVMRVGYETLDSRYRIPDQEAPLARKIAAMEERIVHLCCESRRLASYLA